MKNSGLFLNMAKGCFFVCFFFQALMSLCFLSGKVARVLKMLVFFPSFLGFVGWLLLVYLGLEGLGVFVFLVFAFLLLLFFLALVLFLFVCFVLFCWILFLFFLFFGWMLLFLFLFFVLFVFLRV